jgi:small neutral amino acid transporter SnatA (MarC family)
MDHTSIDIYLVIDTFLLLLIGIGPKIALVPFLEVTAEMDGATKALIVRKMLITAGVTAVILIGLGELLARLLHFSTGSLSIAGGIILVISRSRWSSARVIRSPVQPQREATRCGSRCSHLRSRTC